MRLIVLVLIAISQIVPGHSQLKKLRHSFIHPDYDALLTQIWLASLKKDAPVLMNYAKYLDTEWESTKSIFSGRAIDHFDIPGMIKDSDRMNKSLGKAIEEGRFADVATLSYHILLELRSIRQCINQDIFPLDEIWWMYDEYEGIRYVVNDEMFGKYEWFEFKDMVYRMQCRYEDYNFISQDIIQSFYPGFDIRQHIELKKDLAICVGEFMNSLSSGWQEDFIQPCDKIGESLRKLLSLYKPGLTGSF